ncbi:hypothetical protein [Thioalkalivibrio sp.]|uniref:hypothetical protein n=1 Tax=Thioalkalivibrio sp. TaxID=2093813 RepID=UPI003976E189
MRLILMLAALLIVGLLLYRQIGEVPDRALDVPAADSGAEVPRVPQRPQDLPVFEEQMHEFMQDAGEQRRRQLDALER